MSAGAVIAIAVGGTLVLAGLIVAMMVWLRRSYDADDKAVLGRLNEELSRRGWTYEERNDAYVSVFNAQNQYRQALPQMPTRQNPLAPLQPYHLPPRAVAARQIITGMHRGRPFLAAQFTAHYAGNNRDWFRVIWVRTVAPGPALTVTRSPRMQSQVRKAMGQADLQLGNADFDEQFEVSEADERFARAVLNPAVIQFMLTDPRSFRSMSLLGDQFDLSDQVSDHRDPAQLIPALDHRCDLLDRVPPSAWM